MGEQQGSQEGVLEFRLDELGKKTMESEEVCNSLIEQLKAALEEVSTSIHVCYQSNHSLDSREVLFSSMV